MSEENLKGKLNPEDILFLELIFFLAITILNAHGLSYNPFFPPLQILVTVCSAILVIFTGARFANLVRNRTEVVNSLRNELCELQERVALEQYDALREQLLNNPQPPTKVQQVTPEVELRGALQQNAATNSPYAHKDPAPAQHNPVYHNEQIVRSGTGTQYHIDGAQGPQR